MYQAERHDAVIAGDSQDLDAAAMGTEIGTHRLDRTTDPLLEPEGVQVVENEERADELVLRHLPTKIRVVVPRELKDAGEAIEAAGTPIKSKMYYVIEINGIPFRGKASAQGTFDARPPPDTPDCLAYYDPANKPYGKTSAKTAGNGAGSR